MYGSQCLLVVCCCFSQCKSYDCTPCTMCNVQRKNSPEYFYVIKCEMNCTRE